MNSEDDEIVYWTQETFDPRTGSLKSRISYRNGEMEDKPNGDPAETHFDEHGRERKLIWRSQGTIHRDPSIGPAIVWIDPDTGVYVLEHYKVHGRTSRSDSEPAFIERDTNGSILRATYSINGERIPAPEPTSDIDISPK